MNTMRILNVDGYQPVTTRIFKPWVMGTAGGLCIGCALLTLTNPERSGGYTDMATRAAFYEASRFTQDYSQDADLETQGDLSLPLGTEFTAEEMNVLSAETGSMIEDEETETAAVE
jgi:hypothetical protein